MLLKILNCKDGIFYVGIKVKTEFKVKLCRIILAQWRTVLNKAIKARFDVSTTVTGRVT